ncbi:MAG: hypothetical protein M3389_12035, partial [Actinomycetota bacterium]|nr:hypothetical protein [Actinomycetota bacterium]
AGAILGGLVATLVSALWLYVFIEVLRDDDPTRTTTGFEKVISAFPGIPAAVIGLLALPAGIMFASRNRRGPSLLRTSLIAFGVATLIYVALVIIKG